MQTTAKEKAALSPKSATNTTNGKKPTTQTARDASSGRQFGPNLGELIVLALAVGAGRPR